MLKKQSNMTMGAGTGSGGVKNPMASAPPPPPPPKSGIPGGGSGPMAPPGGGMNLGSGPMAAPKMAAFRFGQMLAIQQLSSKV